MDSLLCRFMLGFAMLLLGGGVGGDRPEIPVMTSGESSIFPESWVKAPISASGEALTPELFERGKKLIERELAKYPGQMLREHLKGVYLLAELRYSGVSTGGTNSRTMVYVTVGEPRLGYTDGHIEGVFHAEFSSILLRNRWADFDAKAWSAINPPDFKYLGDGVEAVRRGKVGQVAAETYYEQGFLRQYSQASMEEDFNGFARAMFRGDLALWEAAERFPRIGQKLRLAIAFYEKIDPTLSEDYFRSLASPSTTRPAKP